MKSAKIARRYRVDDPRRFHLARYDPDDTGRLDKAGAKNLLDADLERLTELQERLYADNRWAVLVVFQGMDAAGKDSVIKHVMSAVDPQGCEVSAFRAPSEEELDHDFLWRIGKALPERGRIGIFNRSHYEEVLVARVHREIIDKQKLPPALVTGRIWQERFDDIRALEKHLARNGTVVLKFFLHVSKDKQRERFLERLEEPAKRWKFSMGDIAERKLWSRYMAAYQDMIRSTSTPEGRWHVVPADHKWFTHLVVAATLVKALQRLDLKYPVIKGKAAAEMKKVRRALLDEGSRRRP
ncbi:MAG TPA: polyphosphate kinase 2 family protein [Xanthobacteraceae bacterium]|nr:polyphosphate kinase 2 family protein [Xanthobacteraceae bacterium]